MAKKNKTIPETMEISQSDRGFTYIHGEHYPPEKENDGSKKMSRAVSESSAIGDYEDSHIPGSSFLWLGDDLHLNREEVKFLMRSMKFWLKHKRLPISAKELTEDRIIDKPSEEEG